MLCRIRRYKFVFDLFPYCYATVFISNVIFYHVHKLTPQGAAKLTGIVLYFTREKNAYHSSLPLWKIPRHDVTEIISARAMSIALQSNVHMLYDRTYSRHAIFVSKVAHRIFSVDAFKFIRPHTHTHTHTPRRCVAVELATLWRPQIWPWVPQGTYGISCRWLLHIPRGGSMWHRLGLFRKTGLNPIREIQGSSTGVEI